MPKILIVDDYAGNRLLLETILRGRGFATLSAPNGSEALRLAAGEDFDLVLSDILMPVMDGFELCRTWKQDARLTKVPFAFYTATYLEPRDEQFGLSLGADRFLRKPLPPEQVLREVQDLLTRKAPAVPAAQVVDESGFFRQHNLALFRKLGTKAADNQRLGASNARYGRILAASLNEIFVFSDRDLRFTFVNQGALDHLGYTEGVVRELTPLDLSPWLGDGRLEALLQPLRDGTQELVMLESELQAKDGSAYPVEIHLEPILDEEALSFLAVALDITERRRQEAETRRLLAEVHHVQKLEGLGRMAASVAHDLNNLLAPIMALAGSLQERCGDEADQQRMLGTIQLAAGRGRDLVKGLTDFARKDILDLEDVDLNALVRETAELLRDAAGPGIRWELDLGGGLAPVRGDHAALGRVVMNLAQNAVDAMARTGVLRLATRPGPADRVELTVTDTGTGIPQELLGQVLEPFFTTKPQGQGTGLGLAIVNGIVRSHAGTLILESRDGQGTTARVQLPTLSLRSRR